MIIKHRESKGDSALSAILSRINRNNTPSPDLDVIRNNQVFTEDDIVIGEDVLNESTNDR